jgi:catechol 2,3-dioxygenase-like lactoylglutathione lyase family enzyme
MSFVGLDHVLLAFPPGRDEEARAFYRGVLGLEEIEKPEPLRNAGFWLKVGSGQLHLGPEEGFRPGKRAHPGLQVDDIDALAARCAAAGYEAQWDDRYTGVRRFYLHDPFGNRLEILQPD